MDDQAYTCTQCQSANKGPANFCRACGFPRALAGGENKSDAAVCPACARAVRASDRFCLNCGNGLKTNVVEEGMFCYRCSRQLPETARYCFGCGLGTAVALDSQQATPASTS